MPLGQGVLPLARYVATLRKARPAAPLCLEMITRDPLPVAYETEQYWVAFDAADRPARVRHFEARVLSKASDRPLPHTTGLTADAQVAAEDEHVAASVEYASPRAEAHGGLNAALPNVMDLFRLDGDRRS